MSKHSKWAKIKRKKGVADVKRGATFTKLTNNVTMAVKEGGGGDPSMNFKLRLAVDAARAQNVPKENIERAIQRGLGAADGTQLEQLVFEGYGPGKIAVIVEVTTDSRNRSVSELKHAFSVSGGAMGGQGSVAWQFEQKGVIRVSSDECRVTSENELALIDSGADDIKQEDDIITVLTRPEHLQRLQNAVEKLNLTIDEAALEWIAKESLTISDPTQQERVAEFLNELEEREDVTGVYTNAVL